MGLSGIFIVFFKLTTQYSFIKEYVIKYKIGFDLLILIGSNIISLWENFDSLFVRWESSSSLLIYPDNDRSTIS
jgi:hypothetical protein